MRRRILLADDSVTIQKVIELTFMDQDYRIQAVSNGDDALARVEDGTADLVIADVHMPGASGYEVARRSKDRDPGVPVLLLVGTFEPFDESQARAAGADSFLKKPFDSQELLQRVGDLLASRQAVPAPLGSPATPAETVRMSELPSMAEMDLTPEPAPAEEWGGFQVEAEPEPEPFSAGSEFSLEEPSQDWRQTAYQPEGEQLFELEEEPAASLVPPADSVFGFEPQPIAAAPQPAGFDLPLAETERLGVPEPATPLVAGLEELLGDLVDPAIDGILEEGSEIMEEYKDTSALDAGLVAAAQAVEHYEIARYGTLASWAKMLDMGDAQKILHKTLEEERQTDEKLSSLAMEQVNRKAA